MIKILRDWFQRYFSDPEAVALFFVLVFGFIVIVFFGNILAPVLASVVIAYLLQWWVNFLTKHKCPRTPAYLIVYLGFLGLFSIALFVLLPLVWRQVITLFYELPTMLQKAKVMFMQLFEAYPAYFTEQQLDVMMSGIIQDVQVWGKTVLSMSISSIPGMIAWLVYLILVPLLVFFFLKDHEQIIRWGQRFVPRKSTILETVWGNMDEQIGNYVRGKVTEITIIGLVTYLVFLYFHLNYAILLAVLVGLSVVIPYIGATVVTLPVALVAYLQWGWGSDFGYLMLAYFVVQAIDGNLLVPLLFSEAVNLHPIAIIVAILVFGAFWGFWGVFFAIPLATLVKVVLDAWPRKMADNSA